MVRVVTGAVSEGGVGEEALGHHCLNSPALNYKLPIIRYVSLLTCLIKADRPACAQESGIDSKAILFGRGD